VSLVKRCARWEGPRVPLWILLISTLVFTYGQPTAPPPKPVVEPSVRENAQAQQQIVVLEAQLKLMRDYDTRLVSTVYWSLATLAGVTFILVGFGWFANFRVYERDKNVLREELNLNLRERIDQAEASVTKISNEQIQRVESSVERTIEGRLNSIRHDVLELQYDQAAMELRMWVDRKVPENELRVAGQMIEIAVSEDNEYHVGRALDVVMHALASGAKPNANDVRRLTSVIDTLPREHQVNADAAREALRRSQIA
jgi:hypothetical protein